MSAPPYVVVPYADRMELAYAAADLVVCRSGANTVCELTAVGLPAVYVPLPIGNGEQRFNAADVLAAGGGLVVDDAAFTPEWITDNVVALAGDGERLLAMGDAAASVGQRDADEALADLVLDARVRMRGGPCHDAAADAVRLPRRVPAAEDLGRVHFVAIGGAGMSGVARIMLARGCRCRAPTRASRRCCTRWRREGAAVHVGHDAALVDDADTVVISSAIRDSNPELRAAHTKGIPVLHRAQALAATMAGTRRVAVAGANGKTTTTSLLTVALQACGVDPSFAVGGELAKHGTNAHLGSGDIFVVEADESDGSFLVYRPEVAIVTSVRTRPPRLLRRPRHRRGGIPGLRRRRSPRAGCWSPARTTPGAVARGARAVRGIRVLTYGESPDADVRLSDEEHRGLAWSAVVSADDRRFLLSAAASPDTTTSSTRRPRSPRPPPASASPRSRCWRGSRRFTGTRRRFEPKGRAAGVQVVDDYAHNAGKVAAVVGTAKQLVEDAGSGRLVVVFQPHLYSPDPRLRRRARRQPRAGRRGRRHGRVRRAARTRSPASPVRLVAEAVRAARADADVTTCPPGRRCPARWPDWSGRATSPHGGGGRRDDDRAGGAPPARRG